MNPTFEQLKEIGESLGLVYIGSCDEYNMPEFTGDAEDFEKYYQVLDDADWSND